MMGCLITIEKIPDYDQYNLECKEFDLFTAWET